MAYKISGGTRYPNFLKFLNSKNRNIGKKAMAISLLSNPRKNKLEAKTCFFLTENIKAPTTKIKERSSDRPTIDVTASVWMGRNIKRRKPARAVNLACEAEISLASQASR